MDKLTGLRTAVFVDKPPFSLEKARTTAQAKGLAYERKVAKAVAALVPEGTQVRHGPWIEYVARSGRKRYAQPDLVLELPDRIVLVEVKLTHRLDISSKIRRFYRRLLRMLYPDREVYCAQVYRNNVAGSKLAPGLEALLGQWPPSEILEVNHR
jgi:hypothetical protein